MEFEPFGRYKEESSMAYLPAHLHQAVQRALHNIWYGHEAAIDEAVESANRGLLVHMDRWRVEEQLAVYVNMIVRQLRPVPETVEPLIEVRKQILQGYIARDHPRLQQLEEESRRLDRAVAHKEQEVQQMRQRLRRLESQKSSLDHRLLEIARAEREVQEQLAAIAEWEPVTLARAQALAEGLAQATRIDLPEKP